MTLDVGRIRAALETEASPERAVNEKRYLKSDLEFIGASVPVIRRQAKKLIRDAGIETRDDLLFAARTLWAEPVHELRGLAARLLEARVRLLESDDLDLVESMLRESRTWALVDLLAVHVAGPLVTSDPDLATSLERWSEDEDFWIRRSAMLALLVPLREGGGDWDRFGRYADAMWDETEFFIRKAIGWVLRDAARRSPDRVVAFVRPRAHRASGVTIREAVKYLDPDERDAILKAYRTKTPID